MLEKCLAAHAAGRLQFFGSHAHLADAKAFAAFLVPLGKKRWFVYAKRPFAGPKAVLAYLSRYTHRVAISNRRLIAISLVTARPWRRSAGRRPGSALHSANFLKSLHHRCSSEPNSHGRPLPAADHALAPLVRRQHLDQIAIARTGTAGTPSPRGFLPWRLSDDGPRASRSVAMGRHPKPFTQDAGQHFGPGMQGFAHVNCAVEVARSGIRLQKRRTSFAPETTSSERNERDRNQTKMQ